MTEVKARVTSEPHDRLTRLADVMGKPVEQARGVRGVILLDDRKGGCVHPVGYPDSQPGRATLFVDTAAHLIVMGEALGMAVEITVNGQKVVSNCHVADSAAGGENMQAFITALENRIKAAEAEIAKLIKEGETRAAELKTAVVNELKALLAELQKVLAGQ